MASASATLFPNLDNKNASKPGYGTSRMLPSLLLSLVTLGALTKSRRCHTSCAESKEQDNENQPMRAFNDKEAVKFRYENRLVEFRFSIPAADLLLLMQLTG